MYFNYHAKAKQLIADGHLTNFQVMPTWGIISPALVLFFDNHKPMPIRKYRWEEYWDLLDQWDLQQTLAETKDVLSGVDGREDEVADLMGQVDELLRR